MTRAIRPGSWLALALVVALPACSSSDATPDPPNRMVLEMNVEVAAENTVTPARAARVSTEFFPAAGLQAFVGRLFTGGDHQLGAPPVVVLQHDYWQERFSGRATIIGTMLEIDGQSTAVIGITPPGFRSPEGVQLWMPLPVN